MKPLLKQFVHLLAMILSSPCALTSYLEQRMCDRSEVVFRFWGDVFSLFPGLPGAFMRRAFYCWTLESCSSNCHIGYGTIFAHRRAVVEDAVYLGTYVLLGEVIIRKKSLIGSRSSLISGGSQHEKGSDGEWTSTETENLQRIEIGRGVWLGEACVIAADVGGGSMVAAGSVVVSKVPADIMVAGNPARFVKKLVIDEAAEPDLQPLKKDESSKTTNLVSAERRSEL